MRVNVYAEEMTDRVEIVTKKVDGQDFTGLRIYLELPVTVPVENHPDGTFAVQQVRGPFKHHHDDDDSSAVTFWGKRDLREVLKKALDLLDEHYAAREAAAENLLPGEPPYPANLPEGWAPGPSGVWIHKKSGATVMRVHAQRVRILSDKNWVYACFPPGTLSRKRGAGLAIAEVRDFKEALQVAERGLPTGWRKHDERNWVHDNGAMVRWCESLRTPAIDFEGGYSAFPPGAFESATPVAVITTELKSFMLALQIAERGTAIRN